MNADNHRYCLILAGGIGSRLWPVSRAEKPKQFLDLFGTGRTLLQQTYDRYARFFPADHIFISTHVDYLPYIREQLPEVDEQQILEEPLQRGTLAAVAWGTVRILTLDAKATVVVSPADQMILNETVFQEDILHGMRFAHERQKIVVLGVPATRPETEYGYIQVSDEAVDEDVYRVKSFTEKPTADFAQMFVKDGSFLWNAGIFAFGASVMLNNIFKLVPEYQLTIPRMMADAEQGDPNLLPEFFNMLPRLSIDLSVMERSQDVYVHRCQFGWADLGAWATLREGADAEGNLTMNTEAVLSNCRNTVILLPSGRKAVVEGLENYVVAESDDVLLICPKDRATVRRMRNEVQLRGE